MAFVPIFALYLFYTIYVGKIYARYGAVIKSKDPVTFWGTEGIGFTVVTMGLLIIFKKTRV